LLKIPQIQCRTNFATIAARTNAPQESQAPLGLISAVGPTGSHPTMLLFSSARAAAPFHIPHSSSRQTCDLVRSLSYRLVLAHRRAALR
jgi:hypothetical protein